jgi:PAS domain S-box-containing protein
VTQHIRILTVEDNPLDAELVERELRRAKLDFAAHRVETEEDFRAALESSDPDIILADYNLPRFDGISALKIAHARVPETPFIFVSGSIGEERAVQALREGATDYILKDRLSRLPAAVTRALDGRRERELRRNAQQLLQSSEERFQYAAQATQEVIWDWDIASGKVWFNEALKTVWRYNLQGDQISVDWWKQRIHPEDRAVILESLRWAIEGQPRWTGGYRFERGNGSYGHVLDRGIIIRDARGQAVRVIRTMLDMTEREAAQETIRRLSHQSELILKFAAEGIVAADRHGKAFVVNPAAARMTGFSLQEMQAATSIHQAIHHSRGDGSPYPAAECPMLLTLQDGVQRVSQDVFWRKSGEAFPVEYSASPIYEGGEIAGVVVMFQDIAERKRLEKSLEQANRVASLGRVAATIAHEFNNVLMGIQPFAEVIGRYKASDEKIQKAAEQIIGSVNRGKRVTQSILRFTQPAAPSLQPVTLSDWLHQLVPELRAVIGQRIVIDIDVPDRPIAVLCDSVQLQQVVTNLVINARDAMPDGGTITLTIADSGSGKHFPFGTIPPEMVLLAVRDTGTGMSAAVQKSIFDPLFTTKRSGTGLGLTVAQQVVAHHGGSIHVQSAPGAGTTFFILLQAAPHVTTPEVKRREKDRRIHRVLLVEDEPAVGEGIAALLEAEGIEVSLVQRGSDAPAAALSFDPDVVVLDVGLPDMNGWDVYLALRKISPGLPIVFSSGHSDQEALERQADASSVAFLRKPYDIDTLIDVLHKVIGEPEQVRERRRS